MITQEMLKRLGQRIREGRTAKGLNQMEVADAISMKQGQYSDLERAYTRGKPLSAIPDDDFLEAVSSLLEIPISELHSILGRYDLQDAAGLLVRGQIAELDGEGRIAPEEVEEISGEVKDFARVRVERRLRPIKSDEAGKGSHLKLT